MNSTTIPMTTLHTKPKTPNRSKQRNKHTATPQPLTRSQKLAILLLIVVISGLFGWIYEFIFYFINSGMKDFYMQGGNFFPWINIYAIGAVLIVATTWRLRRHPWAVFLVSLFTTGILELVAGWLIYKIGGGTRYWDYNTEIWNFGNIGGFVCLRSVLVFGFAALFLIYVLIPTLVRIARKIPTRLFLLIAFLLFAIIMIDEAYNILASKFFDWPDAIDFYRNIGWKYLY